VSFNDTCNSTTKVRGNRSIGQKHRPREKRLSRNDSAERARGREEPARHNEPIVNKIRICDQGIQRRVTSCDLDSSERVRRCEARGKPLSLVPTRVLYEYVTRRNEKRDEIKNKSKYMYIFVKRYISRGARAALVSANESDSFAFPCGPSVRGRISISLPCLFPFAAKESREESRAVRIATHGDMATPWINDRDNGLYGSAGLRIPSHKFRCAYNVKLIRRFLEASLGDFNRATVAGSEREKNGR